ncbi:MAG: glycosyltransferase family A protein [Flavobacterium sp.]|uniref:glycosyltransferase family 2 protein n=1 Tax=Flavobacterium sp. TaxID=239 RepID=UPI003263CFC0
MLSILIPTYNYNVFTLVCELHKQCLYADIEFEIIVFDDGSESELNIENDKINSLEKCKFEILKKNIGRSAIRNLLAKSAIFDNLLFLDSDTLPLYDNFITNYLYQINNDEKVVYGGIEYQKNKPGKEQLFRWTYGTKREALSLEKRGGNPYLSLLTLNFLIKKSVFEKITFNEKIPNQRHEDTLFSYDLMQNKIKVSHIENPVIHLGIDNFDIAIQKEKQSVIALKNLIDNHLISINYVGISRVYHKIKKLKLCWFFSFTFKNTEQLFLKNLSSTNPSIYIFDIYRLGFLCSLNSK